MPKNDMKTPAEAVGRILTSRRALILTHERPDMDTLGSAFGLKYALEGKDRRIEVICADPVIEKYRFITGGREILSIPEGFEPDLICAVDAAAEHMLGGLCEKYAGRVDLKIDHHGAGQDYAARNYTEADSAACGEIVYLGLCGNGLEDRVTGLAADALYAAIASDTGCFKYANTTPRTHRIAAELAERGVDMARINQRLFESKTAGEIGAMRAALDGMHFYSGGRIAVISFTAAQKRDLGFDDDDISPLHGLPREIEGVELGITVRQQTDDPGKYKVSLRSGGSVDCSALCSLFGGGGHRGAAGCTVAAGSMEEAEKMLIDAIAPKVC